MDSGNSGSISSSGDEEYDSRSLLPSNFLNQTTPQFSSISSHQHPQSQTQSSFLSSLHHQTHHHNPSSLFDLSPSYLHTLSQSQQNFPNLPNPPSHVQRSEPNCTTSNTNIAGVSSLAPSQPQGVVITDNNAKATTNIAARNSKKRTRASRRAPTTVLTTDTSNFRAMVQEFTGIPAPPFSGSSYSRRLDLLTASSLRSTNNSSSHYDTSTSFYPLRPSPQKLHLPNPPSTLLHNNMVDAIASSSTTNMSSSATANNLPHDLGLLYNHHQQNFMVSMQNQSQNQNQNHPILTFHNPTQPLHNFGGFGAKSTQAGLSVQSLEDLGVNHGQVNAQTHLVSGIHGHVSSEGMTLRFEGDDDNDNDGNGSRRDMLRSLDGSCKLNFSASASTTLNHDKTLENNNNSTNRGEGAVDSWICSSD